MKVHGLERISANSIEARSKRLLLHFASDYFDKIKPTPLEQIVDFLNETHGIKFVFDAILGFNQQNYRILSACNPKKRVVLVDTALRNDESKFNFTLAHEIGHLALHRNITIAFEPDQTHEPIDQVQEIYSSSKSLKSDSDWMEWQANCYASCLLMPKEFITTQLYNFQKHIGISKIGKIYLDNNSYNLKDYQNLVFRLSEYFNVSWSAVEYRLKKLDLIDDHRRDS